MKTKPQCRRHRTQAPGDAQAARAFALTELMLIIAIIAVLASLLLPALSSAKEQAKLIKCVSNQKQIGLALKLYQDDNNTKFPRLGNAPWEYGGGDGNRSYPTFEATLAATNRPLWPYTRSRELFKCPADRGYDIRPYYPPIKSWFATSGTSYNYNWNPGVPTRLPLADPINGLAGKPENWIPEPSRHILIQDATALPWQAPDGGFFLHQRHYPSGSVSTRDLKSLSKKTVVPALFVGGNVKYFNLNKHFQLNPKYPAEPARDRIWYKAKE